MCIRDRAYGLNVGGKIGIARHEDHVSVAIFLGVGTVSYTHLISQVQEFFSKSKKPLYGTNDSQNSISSPFSS